MRSIRRPWLRSQDSDRCARLNPIAVSTNGMPRPTEYNASNTPPQIAEPLTDAVARIVANTGPTHGTQPAA